MCAVIAVCLGLVAAAMFGAASVLEERSTKQVPERAAPAHQPGGLIACRRDLVEPRDVRSAQ